MQKGNPLVVIHCISRYVGEDGIVIFISELFYVWLIGTVFKWPYASLWLWIWFLLSESNERWFLSWVVWQSSDIIKFSLKNLGYVPLLLTGNDILEVLKEAGQKWDHFGKDHFCRHTYGRSIFVRTTFESMNFAWITQAGIAFARTIFTRSTFAGPLFQGPLIPFFPRLLFSEPLFQEDF